MGVDQPPERLTRVLDSATSPAVAAFDPVSRMRKPTGVGALLGVEELPSEMTPVDLVTPDDILAFVDTASRVLTEGSAEVVVRHIHDLRPILLTYVDCRDWLDSLILVVSDPSPGDLERLSSPRSDTYDEQSATLQSAVDGTILSVSSGMCAMAGYTEDELIGRLTVELIHSEDLDTIVAGWIQVIAHPGRFFHARIRFRRSDGSFIWNDCTFVGTEADGVVTGAGVFVDVDHEVEAARILHERAELDQVTGLANRWKAMQYLAESNAQVGVAFIDLDGFKPINDRFGHHLGDRVLAEIGRRFSDSIRQSDLLARIGGDEFLVISRSLTTIEELVELADRLLERLKAPIIVGDTSVRLRASIGVAAADRDDRDAALMNADHAMYIAKRDGVGVVAFDGAVRADSIRMQDLLASFEGATERGELKLFHQPIVDSATGQIVATEALVRWRRGRDLVHPVELLEVCARSGWMWELGRWTATEAVAGAAAFAAISRPDIAVHFNLSADQLADPHLLESFDVALAASGIDARQIVVELTETDRLDAVEHARERIAEFQARGVAIALDDFGTGWSALEHLVSLNPGHLKLDRKIVSRADDPVVESLIKALSDHCRRCGVAIVAEGVETAEELQAMRRLGVRNIQGWYFGKAQPLSDVLAQTVERAVGALST